MHIYIYIYHQLIKAICQCGKDEGVELLEQALRDAIVGCNTSATAAATAATAGGNSQKGMVHPELATKYSLLDEVSSVLVACY